MIRSPSQPQYMLSATLIFSVLFNLFGLNPQTTRPIATGPATVAQSAPQTIAQNAPQASAPPGAQPRYYYNRETAFVINYGLDHRFGGMYTAVNDDGSLIANPLPIQVWGYPANTVYGSDKNHQAQAVCIRYFVSEYQRLSNSPPDIRAQDIGEMNNLLLIGNQINQPGDLLDHARSCADFVINHLEKSAVDQTNSYTPNKLYYWAFSNMPGTGNFGDDTSPGLVGGGVNTLDAPRSESSIPWGIAELALLLKNIGAPDYGTYQAAAQRWWDWRRSSAIASIPTPSTNYTGIARDLYYGPLGFTLAEITGNASYRNGDGSNQADGRPYGAIPFELQQAGAGPYPDLVTFDPYAPLRSSYYASGYHRGVMYAKHLQQGLGPQSERNRWFDFGAVPHLGTVSPSELGFDTPAQLTSRGYPYDANIWTYPFTHLAGRELSSGVQRAQLFFYSFGIAPVPSYSSQYPGHAMNVISDPNYLRQSYLEWQQFTNNTFWDDTPGRAAWREAVGQPYKPCFSSGTDVPVMGWKPPVIADKVHSPGTPRSTEAVLVTISGVDSPDFEYLNWRFKGIGIKQTSVVYSTDNGATWQVVVASLSAGNTYQASLPPQPHGTTVLYYATASDYLNNITAFPNGAEVWNSAGQSLTHDLARMQRYTVFDPIPGIALTKFTNGEDANLPSGPHIAVGGPVTWTYRITNTGTVPLVNVTLTDDKLGAITCPTSTLAPNEATTCSASGVAQAGQYVNNATVSAQNQFTPDQTVTASNPSHYFGDAPGLALSKFTNGQHAATPPGPEVPAGFPVTWTYRITNTGNVPLFNLVLTDDQFGTVSCPVSGLNVGEASTCTLMGIAQVGQYTNIGSVTAHSPFNPNQVLTASDPSHYYGQALAALGNVVWHDLNHDGRQDPNEPTVPNVGVTLLQNGLPISNTSTDAQGHYGFSHLLSGTYAVNFSLPQAFTWTLSKASSADASTPDDSNVISPNGATAAVQLTWGSINNTIDAGLWQPRPAISLTKRTNGFDASIAPGPNIAPATAVTWTYHLINSGNVTLTNVTVGDDVEGTACANLTLAPGATATCHLTGITRPGPYANVATVTATNSIMVPGVPTVVTNTHSNYYTGLPYAALGNYVWLDADHDGYQGPGEHGVMGILVTLFQNGLPISTTRTDAHGEYLFTHLMSDTYQVMFSLPHGFSWTITTTQSGDTAIANDTIADSNVVQQAADTAGFSNIITLTWGLTNTSIDAGMVANATAVQLLSFSATPSRQPNGEADGNVLLHWVTANEQNTWAFNVYRQPITLPANLPPSYDGLVRLTYPSINAEGRGNGGASYSVDDIDPQPLDEWRYWLEEIDLNGDSLWYGPITLQRSTGIQIYLPHISTASEGRE